MKQWIKVTLGPATAADATTGETPADQQDCAVVIDVLRATTVMTTAGAAGCGEMFTCETTDQAQRLAATLEHPLLCGERHCRPIDGFDLGNSPAEYTAERVAGRQLILTTTNGTRAIALASGARRMLVASFLNLRATLRAVERETHLHLVCAGTNGAISYEDVLLAGAIVDHRCRGTAGTDRNNTDKINTDSDAIELDDCARIARDAWRYRFATSDTESTALARALAQSQGGRNLIAAGFADDIQRCARVNHVHGLVERVGSAPTCFRYRATNS